MWWDPVDAVSASLYESVSRMTVEFREHLGRSIESRTQPLVFGVGSAPDAGGDWNCPLVVASYDALYAEGAEVRVGRYTWANFRAIAAPNSALVALLASWDLEPGTLVDVSGRPVAAARVDPTDEVRTRPPGSAVGTVGVTCTLIATGQYAFITAGHLVTANRVQVNVRATGTTPPAWVSGTVEHWSDPAYTGSTGGYDYAVVVLDDSRDSTAPVKYRGVTPRPQPPYSPSPVTVYGSQTGTLAGSITAALTALGDVQRLWLNVWQFGSQQPLHLGDSGSLAKVTGGPNANSLLGHFVGGAGTTPGFFDHQYIQDLDSCLKSGLSQHIRI